MEAFPTLALIVLAPAVAWRGEGGEGTMGLDPQNKNFSISGII